MSTILTVDFILSTISQEVVGTLFAVALAALANFLWKKHRFGGWTVKVIRPDGSVGTIRPVGRKKMEEVLDDLTTMSVFLKGLVSPYGWLTIDLVTEGREMDVLEIDHSSKQISVDLTVEGCVK
ncbi:hypothetical protein GF360_03695 [candidate division WWE3 bacterium]|nr:hypothetical protein [candidate division WWE3 bacterium]